VHLAGTGLSWFELRRVTIAKRNYKLMMDPNFSKSVRKHRTQDMTLLVGVIANLNEMSATT